MFSMTYTGRASTPFIHSKRLSPTQDRECRRVSPRKTNKSLHYKKMLRLGRGVQTHRPGCFDCLPRRFVVSRSVSENSSSISRISLKRNARVWEFSSHGEDLQELPS